MGRTARFIFRIACRRPGFAYSCTYLGRTWGAGFSVMPQAFCALRQIEHSGFMPVRGRSPDLRPAPGMPDLEVRRRRGRLPHRISRWQTPRTSARHSGSSPRWALAWPAGAATSGRELCSRSASFSLQRALARNCEISNLHVSWWRAPQRQKTRTPAVVRLSGSSPENFIRPSTHGAAGGAKSHAPARARPPSLSAIFSGKWTNSTGEKSEPRRVASRLLLFWALVLALATLGCSSNPRVIVGSKNFTEQVLLGEIIAQHLEQRGGIAVDRKLNLGGTLLAHKALQSGGIDLYPEYTGTALTAVLGQAGAKDPKQVLAQVRAGYAPLGLDWLDPLGFNNTFAMVVRTDTKLQTLSEASARKDPWKLGVGYEFVQRPDGLKGLIDIYSLRLKGDPLTMDLGLIYPALRSGQIEMGAASATDGQLTDPAFTVLTDDRQYFPPYECAVVIRSETWRKLPTLRETLARLSGRIDDAQMRRMNAAVDRDKRNPADVAREFLAKLGN